MLTTCQCPSQDRGSEIKTVFCSNELPPPDRLPRFDEFQTNSPHPMRVMSDDPQNFHARARALDLAAVNVVELTSSTADIRRTPKLIRAADPELYSIVLPLRGRLMVGQGERQATLGEGDLGLYSSSLPFHVHIAAEHGCARLLRTHLHRALLPLPARKIDRLLAVRLPGRDGVGALLAQFLTRLAADSADSAESADSADSAPYRPADYPRLSSVATDLLTVVLAHHLDADEVPPDDAGRSALLLRVKAFVQRHLNDPELSPQTIAAAHHISVSYLHRLFQSHDTTVSAWIRTERLERARRDLADPGLRNLPVHRVAARWGFNDHATFTRAFRAAYDIAPRDYRHRPHASRS